MNYLVVKDIKTRKGLRRKGTIIKCPPERAEPLVKTGKLEPVADPGYSLIDQLFQLAQERNQSVEELLNLKDGYDPVTGRRFCFYLERFLSLSDTSACEKESNCVACSLRSSGTHKNHTQSSFRSALPSN